MNPSSKELRWSTFLRHISLRNLAMVNKPCAFAKTSRLLLPAATEPFAHIYRESLFFWSILSIMSISTTLDLSSPATNCQILPGDFLHTSEIYHISEPFALTYIRTIVLLGILVFSFNLTLLRSSWRRILPYCARHILRSL